MKEGIDYFPPIKSEKRAKKTIYERVKELPEEKVKAMLDGALLNMSFNVPRKDVEFFNLFKRTIRQAFREIHNIDVDAAWMYIMTSNTLIVIVKARSKSNTK